MSLGWVRRRVIEMKNTNTHNITLYIKKAIVVSEVKR